MPKSLQKHYLVATFESSKVKSGFRIAIRALFRPFIGQKKYIIIYIKKIVLFNPYLEYLFVRILYECVYLWMLIKTFKLTIFLFLNLLLTNKISY